MRISIYVFYVSFADILYWSIEKKIDWPKTFDLHYISNINSLIKLKDTLFYWIDIEIGNIQDCSIWGYYKFEGDFSLQKTCTFNSNEQIQQQVFVIAKMRQICTMHHHTPYGNNFGICHHKVIKYKDAMPDTSANFYIKYLS